MGLLDLLGRGSRSIEAACELGMALADEGRWISLRTPHALSADRLHDAVTMLHAAGIATVSEFHLPLSASTDAAWAGDEVITWTFTEVRDPVATIAPRMAAFGERAALELPAARRRTESECREHLVRTRLVRGATGREGREHYSSTHEADKAFVRCAKLLLDPARDPAPLPSFETSDARLIEIVQALALRFGRGTDSLEFAVPYGRDRDILRMLDDGGARVRIGIDFEMAD